MSRLVSRAVAWRVVACLVAASWSRGQADLDVDGKDGGNFTKEGLFFCTGVARHQFFMLFFDVSAFFLCTPVLLL